MSFDPDDIRGPSPESGDGRGVVTSNSSSDPTLQDQYQDILRKTSKELDQAVKDKRISYNDIAFAKQSGFSLLDIRDKLAAGTFYKDIYNLDILDQVAHPHDIKDQQNIANLNDLLITEQFKAFSKDGETFTPAIDFNTTERRIRQKLKEKEVPNIPPTALVEPWECRIGGSKFYVPPTSISVNTTFKAGAYTGGALRAPNSPKFNTGHSETSISLTLYFPNHESIWGFEGDSLTINFDDQQSDNLYKIDAFLGSLRGLITQFKYAPFLPVKNVYLNKVYNITGVALHSMTVSTMENYPFTLVVQLNMLKFNHKVYIPAVSNFDEAVHWGRFRQFIGKAALRLDQMVSRNFFTASDTADLKPGDQDNDGRIIISSDTISYKDPLDQTFNKKQDWADGRNLEIWYPSYEWEGNIFVPSLYNFESPNDPETQDSDDILGDAWRDLLASISTTSTLGLNDYNSVSKNYRDSVTGANRLLSREWALIVEWLKSVGKITQDLNSEEQEKYIKKRLKEALPSEASDQTKAALTQTINEAWFAAVYDQLLQSPWLQNVLDYQRQRSGYVSIKEWEVPMLPVGLDPSKVFVQGVSVSMGNNIVRLQISMEEDPIHQHIGGLDTNIDISMIVVGEQDLIRLRRVFESINGLTRLQHNFAVLGFIGIKNVVSSLCGVKYVMPQKFEVDTVPNYPHVYTVKLSFIDFDIFQQKREELSSNQQRELVNAFGKRNPFLRIKQLWGAFNAYPDLPLDLRDNEGSIIGHMDPDYYFKAWEMIDDDILYPPQNDDTDFKAAKNAFDKAEKALQKEQALPVHVPGKLEELEQKYIEAMKALAVERDKRKKGVELQVHVGNVSEESTMSKYNIYDDGFDVISGDVAFKGGKWGEPTAADTRATPRFPGGTSARDNLHTTSGAYGEPANMPEMYYSNYYSLRDLKYRDKSGRMIRAFPTYMLWLIDEGGQAFGVKLFDSFYGMQSIIDMSYVGSEDVLGDTLVLRLSNLYAKLSTPHRNYVDDRFTLAARIINDEINKARNVLTGLTNYLIQVDTIDLKPGVRVHLRMGYSANPNALETIFNGVITQVETGDIVTITCQSDAIELGGIVNTRDKDAHSGRIDGSLLTGWWLSEPRDLMVRLLSMGASQFREYIAWGTRGKIFSGNKFGIRHFGVILYDPMTPAEEKKNANRGLAAKRSLEQIGGFNDPSRPEGVVPGMITGVGGLVRGPVWSLIQDMWEVFLRKRDFELFKRNIYPGNGLGVAQYLGGDMGDGGLAQAYMMGGVREDGTFTDPMTGENLSIEDPLETIAAAAMINKTKKQDQNATESQFIRGVPLMIGRDAEDNPTYTTVLDTTVATNSRGSDSRGIPWLAGLLSLIGVRQRGDVDDDLDGFDEVSFRAQTYMKSVWDLFQLCAGLLPNYIVAVRPFEERSTVFYGKPGWMYTSGVIPLSTGVQVDSTYPPPISPEQEFDQILRRIQKQVVESRRKPNIVDRLKKVTQKVEAGLTQPYGTKDANILPSVQKAIGEVASGGKYNFISANKIRKGKYGWTKKGFIAARDASQDSSSANFPDDPRDWTNDGQDAIMRDELRRAWDKWKDWGYVIAEHYADAKIPTDPAKWSSFPSAADNVRQYVDQVWSQVLLNIGTRARATITAAATAATATNTAQPSTGTGQGGGLDGALFAAAAKAQSSIGQGQDGALFAAAAKKDAAVLQTQIDIDGAVADIVNNVSPTKRTYYKAINPRKNPPGWFKPGREALLERNGVLVPVDTPEQYAYWFGYNDLDIPFNYSSSDDGWVDVLGNAATDLFRNDGSSWWGLTGTDKDKNESEEIWKEFKTHFKKTARNVWNSSPDRKAIGKKTFDKVFESFLKWMWRDAFNRGWLVRVADRKTYVLGTLTDGLEAIETGAKSGWLRDIMHFSDPTWWVGEVAEGGLGLAGIDVEIPAASDVRLLIAGAAAGLSADVVQELLSGNEVWSFIDRPAQAFRTWIEQGENATKEFMISNRGAGKLTEGALSRGLEDLIKPIADIIDDVVEVAVAAFTGIINLLRMTLLTLSQGIGLATTQQKLSNMLNRVFNDSIYYSAGPPGSLLYLADNPFTREYGEPVVEIREPFQRIHYINSYQHILNNGIVESREGVATVVTANSEGGSPVSVYFDKGMSTELQVEKAVETGLFWDKPNGFIDGLLHPNTTIRYFTKAFGNGDDETSSKRVALYHLKESLKDIYTGEIIIIGDPSIRPHDLVWMADEYEKMFGLFEVEQVVHHFTPDTGFITSITPNAVVYIEDPARWSFHAHLRAKMQAQYLRNSFRGRIESIYGGIHKNMDNPITASSSVNLSKFTEAFEDQIKGSVSFHGGVNSLIKDVASAMSLGILSTDSANVEVGGKIMEKIGPLLPSPGKFAVGALASSFLLPGFGTVISVGLYAFLKIGWEAWTWVRDNLLDQHNCVIQYLTKNGVPMDATLQQSYGVAVGQQKSIVFEALGIPIRLPAPGSDGDSYISTNDLLGAMGWNQKRIEDLVTDVDWWTNNIKARVLKDSGRFQEAVPFIAPRVEYVTVTNVVSGEIIEVAEKDIAPNGVRIAAIDTPQKGLNLFLAERQSYELVASKANAEQSPVDPGPKVQAVVDRVIDGDTIVLSDGEEVRLLGVDTPETHHPTKGIECYGPEAAAYTRSLLPHGTKILLEYDEELKDEYNRTLAYVYLLDGTDVQLALLKYGYARTLSIEPNTRYAAEYQQAQNEAYQTGAGLWSACPGARDEPTQNIPRDPLTRRAFDFANQRLLGKKVALRINPTSQNDTSGRLVAMIFHNAPPNVSPTERQRYLTKYARDWPGIEWDTYLPDGRAYTYNWEAVEFGVANVDSVNIGKYFKQNIFSGQYPLPAIPPPRPFTSGGT